MKRINQSFVYNLFEQKGKSCDELFRFAVKTGFLAVEAWFLDENREEFVARARKAGLRVASFIGHHDLQNGLNNTKHHDRIEAELRENIDFASKHDIPGLICLSGKLEHGRGSEEAADAIVEGLSRVKSTAEKLNVNLNLEMLNTIIDHTGYQLNNTQKTLEIVSRLNSPNIKLLYDIYHMQIMEGNLIQTITEKIGYIGHFHTAGVPGRFDLDKTQEINYPAVMQAIAETGYELYVGHEFNAKGANKFDALAKAFEVCAI